MALIDWRVPASLPGRNRFAEACDRRGASAFQLAGEPGIVASRAPGAAGGRASGGVEVVGQPIDAVVGAAQETA
jgi:hypothetical protein